VGMETREAGFIQNLHENCKILFPEKVIKPFELNSLNSHPLFLKDF